ncbi:CHAT domain-containing protein, partial [Collybia nuda]
MPDGSTQVDLADPERYLSTGDNPHISGNELLANTPDSKIQVNLAPFTNGEIQGSTVWFENRASNDRDVSIQTNLNINPNLDSFITNLRKAVEETSNKPQSAIIKDLEELANALTRRYRLLDRVEDLREKIQIYQRIITLPCPPGITRSLTIRNLSITIEILSKRVGKIADISGLDACIGFQREEVQAVLAALELPNQQLNRNGTNPRHRTLLLVTTDLADSLMLQYTHSGNVAALEEAAKHLRHSLSVEDNDVAFFPLANVLNELANRTHDLVLRDEAILYYQKASEHPSSQRHSFLDHLASALQMRFRETASPDDAIKALQTHLEALGLQSLKKIQRYHTLYNIALLYILPGTPFYDISLSVKYTLLLVGDTYGDPHDRLRLARPLLQNLRPLVLSSSKKDSDNLHTSFLEIYGTTVRLLPLIAVLDLDIKSRLSALADSETLGVEAALLAIDLSQPELALELLEAGRSVFWSQARNLRTPLNTLPPELAEEFITLSRTLEKSSHLIHHSGMESMHDEALVTRRFQSDRFLELTREIRTFPGFEDFLVNKPYSSLAKAALKGPIVVLIPSTPISHAILIKSTGSCSHVQLKLPKERLQKLGMSLRAHNLRNQQAGDNPEDVDGEERYIVRQTVDYSYELLGELWSGVVEPIINALGLLAAEGRERPRVTWLPTGSFTFLPIHAAGVYRAPVRCCSNYMVSSYTPSINALLDAQQAYANSTVLRREAAKALLVAVSDAPGLPRLPNIRREIEAIEKIIPLESILDISDGAPSGVAKVTSEMVLGRFAEASIVHLACHGQQDALNPLESGFCVEDGRLTVAQLMEQNSQKAFFAFLSACETAKGDSSQPDQSVHLAAAMLFAGFKSVVGTMWSMNDQDGPIVATKVYSQLFKNEVLDTDEVPYALDDAMRELRERGLRPSRWALFIHMGI